MKDMSTIKLALIALFALAGAALHTQAFAGELVRPAGVTDAQWADHLAYVDSLKTKTYPVDPTPAWMLVNSNCAKTPNGCTSGDSSAGATGSAASGQ